jgi:uncharacterized protein (TIGR02444 family)
MSASPSSSEGSPFWRFSLAFYQMPEVAPACLRLQDEAGVDVNLLLFLLWNAAQGRRLAADAVADADRHVSEWRGTVVHPLRALRRALKTTTAGVAADLSEGIRSRVKSVELEAERIQQELMYELSHRLVSEEVSPRDAARANIAAYQAASARPFPPQDVAIVLDAFAKFTDRDVPSERRETS